MELTNVYPDQEKTFGEIIFIQRGKDKFLRDPLTKQTTGVLEARKYILSCASEAQLEVQVPASEPEFESKFKEVVRLVNPVLTNYASSTGNNFARVNWTLKADRIEKVNTNDTLRKNETQQKKI